MHSAAHPLYGSIGLEENFLRQSHLGWRLMELVPVLDHNKLFVTDKNGVKRRANKFEISRREEQLLHQCVWLLLEKSVEELVLGGRFVHCGDDVVRKFVQVWEITELRTWCRSWHRAITTGQQASSGPGPLLPSMFWPYAIRQWRVRCCTAPCLRVV